ncbi:type II glyceraldehyde-3-phosphate dehydrogenase, partial [Candidatus Woesearchaeota archaeon]|nr:type II glyceraldehyde-3-phosphate dehydrogenase [Candidatus Woesearchaeota archaeon]
LKAIFQGGEKHELTGLSFNSDCNYEQASGRRLVRVVSCNTTALCRVISTLNTTFQIRKIRATLVRRSADQSDGENSIINTWVPDTGFPSHHSHDVKCLMPGLQITTLAGIAPMTLMHGHMLFIELEKSSKPADAQGVIETLECNPRILLCSSEKGLTSTAKLKDLFSVSGNGRNGNVYEVCVWKEGIGIDSDGEIGMHIAIDQQADVVPENIDAIRAMCTNADRQKSVAVTNHALGIGLMMKKTVPTPLSQIQEAFQAMPTIPAAAKDL